MSNDNKGNNSNYGYQPKGLEQRGYQPTNPGNGYQPSTSSNPPSSQPTPPPSSGSSVQK